MKKLFLTITLLMTSLTLQAASGFVVIASIDSTIPRGAVLEPAQAINLDAGAALTVISANGRVIQLKGPYEGTIDSDTNSGSTDILQSISSLVKYSKDEDLSLAGFRNISLNTESNLIEIWGVDIENSGQYCLQADLPLNLLWPAAFKGAIISLSNDKTLEQAKFRWATKQPHIAWPTGFKIDEDTTYTIKNNVAKESTQFSLKTLPADIESDMSRIVWMFENACQRQAIRLLKEIIRPPVTIK